VTNYYRWGHRGYRTSHQQNPLSSNSSSNSTHNSKNSS